MDACNKSMQYKRVSSVKYSNALRFESCFGICLWKKSIIFENLFFFPNRIYASYRFSDVFNCVRLTAHPNLYSSASAEFSSVRSRATHITWGFLCWFGFPSTVILAPFWHHDICNISTIWLFAGFFSILSTESSFADRGCRIRWKTYSESDSRRLLKKVVTIRSQFLHTLRETSHHFLFP